MTNIIIAGAVGLILSMLGTPLAIRLFSRRGYGQEIREEGVQAHLGKRGTPTMGGIVFVLASLLAYGASHLAMLEPPTVSGGLVLFLMTGLGAVGFLDDFIKIYKQRSLGLRSGAKALGQLIVGAVFAVLVTRQPNVYGITPAETRLSFLRDFGPPSIGIVGFTIWVLIMIVGFSNAVNLTDGLDGLASGATGVVLAAYVLIGNWQLRNNCIDQLGPNCYWVRDPLDLAVVAAAVLGALIGFLWWNAPPARIFMGDTGSLALGGVLAGLAIATRTQLLLIILAGLCVMITLSVIIQVGFFKMTGKRVFRMAPLQHHFELKGWAETTIVVRFWLIAMLCAALGLGLFYVEWMPR
ncbi:phospho-N-acetylmuramoyl-pentapeptide-transferase [Nonomuraea fuscirosea]|uniref:Phospho-N-acetylmuramoyl-pentapeptide-transferase n=2 Tax=Nonomuraea TaxID=83681 RepID=A0A2T0MV08_9ACTN|nr:phospho-N-acetylmuramoyl-pentapeptide-transferase [Nonomuraea fuscirosea]PRX62653.1 phospho-N-acetylmuramoyl-pentapeptide-transferase [Nonomuraea fuscirosea]WSA47970.1 phospho-N-acetylmuramoyl-pentapeptide-transferase [Nonomuraea fuscirosea]